jgi:hypothetical protein
MFDAEKKSGASFYGCLFLYRSGLSFFFNKMHSPFVSNPNLTAVKIYGFWLLLHGFLQSNDVGFIANVDPKRRFTRLVVYVRSTEELFLNSWSANHFPLYFAFWFFQGYNSDGKNSNFIFQ